MTHHSIAGFSKIGAALTLIVGLSSGLSGCAGFEGVELQGGVFDALGVSTATNRDSSEPKVAQRHGLIVPPSTQALPAPGSGQVAAQSNQSWPTNPEQAKITKAALKEKTLQKYCDDRKWWEQSDPTAFNKATNNGELCVSPLAKAYFRNKKN